MCRVSEANRILSRQTFINSWRTKSPNRSIAPFVVNIKDYTRAAFPWQGTVGWALGRVSAHKRSVCRVSEANRTRVRTNVRDNLCQLLTQFYRVCRVSAANRTFPNKRCTKYRIHFGANNRANCRGEITPTAVVYSVHTLYIHVWILPLSAKLVHIELLLTQVSHG